MKLLHGRILFVFILLFTTALAGCSGSGHDGIIRTQPTYDRSVTGRAEAGDFEELLQALLALPADSRSEIRKEAEDRLKDWRGFEAETDQVQDSQVRARFHMDMDVPRSYLGNGLTNSLHDLKAATEIDPSFVEAWVGLGRLCAVAGDLHKGREYLDRGLQVAASCRQAGREIDPDLLLQLHRERCWVLRDLGLWNEALEAVNLGLAFRGGDRELVLIKGLVLAGAGRFEEANSLAVRMEPFTYPRYDTFHAAGMDQTSDFPNRWIKSQALIAIGEYKMARHVLGEMTSLPYRHYIPLQRRFWNDVGLAAELAGDPEAGTFYALSLIGDQYLGYYPWQGGNLRPLVLDQPPAHIPFYTSFGGRFLVSGSLLGYAASQMNMMAASAFDGQRQKAAWRAREALNLAERRNIRPNVARAMRGRINFSLDERHLARRDLVTARNGFLQQGVTDSGTSLLLGLLEMTEGNHPTAIPYLEESLAADETSAVAWRSLGVCLARSGQRGEAARAMDRALALEPNSVSGLYNRGLYHLQGQDFEPAIVDLDRALRLDPENHEVQRLLQMAAAGLRAEGGSPAKVVGARGDAAGAADLDLPTQEQILASLERDIRSFFSLPDSLAAGMGPGDPIITGLTRQWQADADPMVRKILALAYMDRGLHAEAQELLAPGWGVDLTPEEELMLLYVDRILGEEVRARELSRMILTGQASPENPYIYLMLPREDRKHWTQTMLVKNHFFEGYQASVQGLGDLQRFSLFMRNGYWNLRQLQVTPDGTVMAAKVPNEFRIFQGEDGVRSGTSGSRPVSGKKVGNVVK
jgi:tetratricopeptide (TPR) repeat protein